MIYSKLQALHQLIMSTDDTVHFFFSLLSSVMVSTPITSWQIDGETIKIVTDFIYLSSEITKMVIATMKLKDVRFLQEKL